MVDMEMGDGRWEIMLEGMKYKKRSFIYHEIIRGVGGEIID